MVPVIPVAIAAKATAEANQRVVDCFIPGGSFEGGEVGEFRSRVTDPACRLVRDSLVGLEAKRRWGPPERYGIR